MTTNHDCDVAVVGAGPAGLGAAAAAAAVGGSVVVVDSYLRSGGQYYRQPADQRRPATTTQKLGRDLVDRVDAAGVQVLNGHTIWAADPQQRRLELLSPSGLHTLHYRSLVIATGAHERSAAFPGWTLPGVYTAGAIQTLLKEHGVVPGQRVVLAGSGPLQLVVGAALVGAGVAVAGLYEATRVARHGLRHPAQTLRGAWRQTERAEEAVASIWALARHRVPIHTGWGITRAAGTRSVEGAVVAKLDHDWQPVAGSERHIACDTIATHYSLAPAVELLQLLGAELAHRPHHGGWVPVCDDSMATTVGGVFAAGDCTGIGGVDLSLIEGEIAGGAAAAHTQGRPFAPTPGQLARRNREHAFQDLYGGLFSPRLGLTSLATPDTLVCRCEDVTTGDVDRTIDRGVGSLEAVKAITRCGMGPCQGRVCGPIVSQRFTKTTGRIDPPFTARPPLNPLPIGLLSGEAP